MPCTHGGSLRAALRRALPALFAALSLACQATESFDPPSSPRLAAAEPLPVTLSNDLRGLRERDTNRSQETTFKIGRLMRRLFVARDGRAFLSTVTSNLDTEWQGPGETWKSTYSLSVQLQLDGNSHLVTAYSARSASGPELAGHQAIEDCVTEVYARVAELLRRPIRSGA
jgi:hypothetical protein